MTPVPTLFFGSTTDSVLVLEAIYTLKNAISISAVVTQPPRPVGREQIVTPTPVEAWAKKHDIPVLSFPTSKDVSWQYENEETVINALSTFKVDLLVTASYGQKVPSKIINNAKFGGINVHPSLLPRWRGGDPVPWAMYEGDAQVGVTVVTLTDEFDEGLIVAQKKIPLHPTDTPDPIRTELFRLGAQELVEILPLFLTGKIKGEKPKPGDYPLARRFTKQDGFEPWNLINQAMKSGKDAERIERKCRAFSPWPGLWTTISIKGEDKRLKILSARVEDNLLTLDQVQLEGKKPTSFSQFKQAYLS